MSVLILGATSPIARALAQRYAAEGHSIFAAARDPEEAARIAADLRVRHQVETASGAFDALDIEQHDAFVEGVEQALGPVEIAMVAFGVMTDQEQAQQQEDFAQARRVIDTNYTGAASVCEALARRMSARGRGHIIGITSVAGDRGRQSNYFYGSAKGAFTLYLQGLRNRLYHDNVGVLTVKPGFVDTRMTFGTNTSIPVASPEEAAQAIHRAQQRGQDVLYYPRFWRGLMGIIKALPERVFKRLSL